MNAKVMLVSGLLGLGCTRAIGSATTQEETKSSLKRATFAVT